jgi:hypothetical protein
MFRSKFTLRIEDEELEEKYNEMIRSKIMKRYIALFFLGSCYFVPILIYYIVKIYTSTNASEAEKNAAISVSSTTATFIIFVILMEKFQRLRDFGPSLQFALIMPFLIF